MGRCIIHPNQKDEDDKYCNIKILKENGSNDIGKPVKPKWHDFHYKQGGPPCGKVLASFVVAPSFDYKFK